MQDQNSSTFFDHSVVVLIPHFNNLEGLKRAVQSILYDKHVLVLIVDDGSLEGQIPKIGHFNLPTNFSIKILYCAENFGIEHALNKGLHYILDNTSATYIARLDCGDRMVNNRLKKQTEFLDSNKEIALVGSWVQFVLQEKDLFTLKLPTNHSQIYKMMMLRVCFIHPAVTFRLSSLDHVGDYPVNFPAAEDYAFFMKFVTRLKTANLPEVLTLVESDPNGISITKRKMQLMSRLKVICAYTTNRLYFVLGFVKLLILLLVPFPIVNGLKKIVYK